jgi:LSU ribosomal protein L24P
MAAKLKVKVGDTVKVISGEDKNKKDNTGKVQKVFPRPAGSSSRASTW